MKAIRLKSAHLINPLGIDIQAPLLTWTCEDGIRQTAFQVIAEQHGKALWDSGRVETNAMSTSMPSNGRRPSRASMKPG